MGDPDPKYGLCFQGPKNYFSVLGLDTGWLDDKNDPWVGTQSGPKLFF